VIYNCNTQKVLVLSKILATFVTSLITTMNNRLKQFLAAENITQSQFADKIEVVRASVSHVLSGRNNPSYEFLKAMMENYPALNMEWLMFGKGRMYKDAETPLPPVQKQESAALMHEEGLFGDLFPKETDEDMDTVQNGMLETTAAETDEAKVSPALQTHAASSIKDLISHIQQPVKQRSVTKIIVLFDDGSYQEL